jgi:hypothetical protein
MVIMMMKYEEIYNAAVNQDLAELNKALGLDQDSVSGHEGEYHRLMQKKKYASDYFYAAERLAYEENIQAVNFLIDNDSLYGAIYAAIRGAARGNRKLATELLRRERLSPEPPTWAAWGYSEGGHNPYFKECLNIILTLHSHGFGNYEHLCSPEILAAQNPQSQLPYLSFHQFDKIPTIIQSLKKDEINIEASIKKRAMTISKHMYQNHLSYQQAYVYTDPSCRGMIYILMLYGNGTNLRASHFMQPLYNKNFLDA